MGREIRELRIVASVSRHNSDQDEKDDKRWEEVEKMVRKLEKEYEDIILVVV